MAGVQELPDDINDNLGFSQHNIPVTGGVMVFYEYKSPPRKEVLVAAPVTAVDQHDPNRLATPAWP